MRWRLARASDCQRVSCRKQCNSRGYLGAQDEGSIDCAGGLGRSLRVNWHSDPAARSASDAWIRYSTPPTTRSFLPGRFQTPPGRLQQIAARSARSRDPPPGHELVRSEEEEACSDGGRGFDGERGWGFLVCGCLPIGPHLFSDGCARRFPPMYPPHPCSQSRLSSSKLAPT